MRLSVFVPVMDVFAFVPVLVGSGMCMAVLQVRHRWEELSAPEQQQVTQLAYQHLQDGKQQQKQKQKTAGSLKQKQKTAGSLP